MKSKTMKAVHSISVEDALDNGIFPKRFRKAPPGVPRWCGTAATMLEEELTLHGTVATTLEYSMPT